MNKHADKTQKNNSQSVANGESQMQSSGESTFQFVDDRPEAVARTGPSRLSVSAPLSESMASLKKFVAI